MVVKSESREQPGPTAATGAAGGRLSRPASESPLRLVPPTTANAPDGPAAEGAADASPPPAEHEESEDPTLLPAA
jgi:hypothetical protein